MLKGFKAHVYMYMLYYRRVKALASCCVPVWRLTQRRQCVSGPL